MKKKFKTACVAVAIPAVGIGLFKSYNNYFAENLSVEDMLLAENIEAMASGGDSNNSVENGTVDVCVYHRPCYKEEIDDTRTVTNPYTKEQSTEYHHTLKTYYYQVCVNKNYKEAQNFNLCDRSKIVGQAGCSSIGGSTNPSIFYYEGWYKW